MKFSYVLQSYNLIYHTLKERDSEWPLTLRSFEEKVRLTFLMNDKAT